MHLWSSLYIPLSDDEQVFRALDECYQTAGYQAYNPFPGGRGSPQHAHEFIKLFVKWGEDGWTRIIGTPDESLLTPFSKTLANALLYLWVDETQTGIQVIGSASLADFLVAGQSLERFNDALNADYADQQTDEIADFAVQQGVDPKQANKLIQKNQRKIAQQMGMEPAEVKQPNRGFSWELGSAQRLRAGAACLRLPSNWHSPLFKDITSAYQIASLLEQDENALLLPGDEAVLDRVDYPLDYHLAYYAR